MGQLSNMLYLASIWVIPVVIAVTFHEAAHGFVARFLGDETAWKLGRVSLNPIKHIDPVGTILLPGFLLLLGSPFLFGYAKPVPVNFRALHHAMSYWLSSTCFLFRHSTADASPSVCSRTPLPPGLPG